MPSMFVKAVRNGMAAKNVYISLIFYVNQCRHYHPWPWAHGMIYCAQFTCISGCQLSCVPALNFRYQLAASRRTFQHFLFRKNAAHGSHQSPPKHVRLNKQRRKIWKNNFICWPATVTVQDALIDPPCRHEIVEYWLIMDDPATFHRNFFGNVFPQHMIYQDSCVRWDCRARFCDRMCCFGQNGITFSKINPSVYYVHDFKLPKKTRYFDMFLACACPNIRILNDNPLYHLRMQQWLSHDFFFVQFCRGNCVWRFVNNGQLTWLGRECVHSSLPSNA
jgi:hypothetical protein